MKTFTDNAGRTWTVSVNVTSVKRVRKLLEVNLVKAVEGKLLERLTTDPVLLCDVVYVLCKPEVDKKKVSGEDFGRAMAGDAISYATTALLEDLVDFFPLEKRRVLAKALKKLRSVEKRAAEYAVKKLDDPELDKEIDAALKDNTPLKISKN